jgi:hypothetical protein
LGSLGDQDKDPVFVKASELRRGGLKKPNERAVLAIRHDRAFDDRDSLFRRNCLLLCTP